MPDLYYAATCQTDFANPLKRGEITERTRRMCALVEQTITGYEPFFDVRLLVFPEFAHAAPVYDNVAALRKNLAVPVPNEHTDQYGKLCRKYGCYIQTGSFIEAEPDYPGVVFNTTLLIGPKGVLSRYRKINTWIPMIRGRRMVRKRSRVVVWEEGGELVNLKPGKKIRVFEHASVYFLNL